MTHKQRGDAARASLRRALVVRRRRQCGRRGCVAGIGARTLERAIRRAARRGPAAPPPTRRRRRASCCRRRRSRRFRHRRFATWVRARERPRRARRRSSRAWCWRRICPPPTIRAFRFRDSYLSGLSSFSTCLSDLVAIESALVKKNRGPLRIRLSTLERSSKVSRHTLLETSLSKFNRSIPNIDA